MICRSTGDLFHIRVGDYRTSEVFAVDLSVLDDPDAFAESCGEFSGMPKDPNGLSILSYPCLEPRGFRIYHTWLYSGQLRDPLEIEADEEDKTDLDFLIGSWRRRALTTSWATDASGLP